MATMNIFLPDELKAFVDAQVAEHAYGSTSEYLRELIRKQRDVEKLRAMLLEGANSGPGRVVELRLSLGITRHRQRRGRCATGKPVQVLPQAERDLRQATVWYREHGGVGLAVKWTDAVVALRRVGAHPRAGASRHAVALKLDGLRFWPIQKFPYLISYIEREDRVDVWRVRHAQRDIPAWMGDASGPSGQRTNPSDPAP